MGGCKGLDSQDNLGGHPRSGALHGIAWVFCWDCITPNFSFCPNLLSLLPIRVDSRVAPNNFIARKCLFRNLLPGKPDLRHLHNTHEQRLPCLWTGLPTGCSLDLGNTASHTTISGGSEVSLKHCRGRSHWSSCEEGPRRKEVHQKREMDINSKFPSSLGPESAAWERGVARNKKRQVNFINSQSQGMGGSKASGGGAAKRAIGSCVENILAAWCHCRLSGHTGGDCGVASLEALSHHSCPSPSLFSELTIRVLCPAPEWQLNLIPSTLFLFLRQTQALMTFSSSTPQT